MMQKFISKSFTTVDPRVCSLYQSSNIQRKYDTSPDLQLDETSTPWRVTTAENNVAIVNTYTVQPTGTSPTTPGAEGASPGDDDDDGDGLDQLSVKFTRSYHVNKSPKKSPRKGSVQAQHGLTPPPSTTFSPPVAQGQFMSPGEGYLDPFDYTQQASYEGLGIANGMVPQGYTIAPVPQYIASPNMPSGQMQPQYLRSPMPMMAQQPLQPLQGNPHVQRSPGRMMQVPLISPMAQQMPFAQTVQVQPGRPQRMVRQQTQPQPVQRQMAYDENALMQAALLSQMRQQQQQQLQQGYLSPQPIPQSPQRIQKTPQKLQSRSLPSSPEKRKYTNQLAQVSELDILSIPTPLVSSPVQPKFKQAEAQPEEPKISHLRGISFLDELFEVPAESKGPLAPDGTLLEEDENNEAQVYDDAALEADVNAWLEDNDLTEGTGWLDQVVLN